MLLTITTTHQPATDLGYLLMKHPDRVHSVDLAFGRATLFYPEASEERCTAAITLEIDSVELVRGKGQIEEQYVSDRPYAASASSVRWRCASSRSALRRSIASSSTRR